MNTVEEIKEYLQKAIRENGDNFFELDNEEFIYQTGEDWVDDGKYQFASSIWKHEASDTYWEITNHRSGSYYTDCYYSNAEFRQVKPVEVVVTSWEPV